MEGSYHVLPLKRGNQKQYIMPQKNLKVSQTLETSKKNLNALQSQYKSDFKLEKLKGSTWQYIQTNNLSGIIFTYNTIELLTIAVNEFMLTELEYIAVISLLQQKKLLCFNIPIDMLLDLSCYIVKLQMDTDEVLAELLYRKLSERYPSFEENLKIFTRVLKINMNELNKIYGDFQQIMTQEPNYCVRVGEILRNSPPYSRKNNNTEAQKEKYFEGDKEIDLTSEICGLNYGEKEFLSLVPVDKQKSKDIIPEIKKKFVEFHYFLNNQEFENGFYVAEEFESIV